MELLVDFTSVQKEINYEEIGYIIECSIHSLFSMKTIKKIAPSDYRLVPKDADSNFDAKRNQQVVEEVIEETEKIWEAKRKASHQKLEERTDAVATYLHSLEQGKGNSNMEKYFGRKHLAYLRGQQIIRELKHAKT